VFPWCSSTNFSWGEGTIANEQGWGLEHETRFPVGLFLVVLPLVAVGQAFGTRTATIKIDGPAVIGFFPPVKQLGDDNPDDAVIEITGQLSDALDDTGECLKKSGIAGQFGNRINPGGEGKRQRAPDRAAEILAESRRSLFVQTGRGCARHLRRKRSEFACHETPRRRRRIFCGAGVWQGGPSLKMVSAVIDCCRRLSWVR